MFKVIFIHGIGDSSLTDKLPYIPGSSLRGALRTALMKSTDNLIASNSNNNSIFLLLTSLGSGKSSFSRLHFNKVRTSDYRKAIQLSLFGRSFGKINLRRDATNYLTIIKEEGYQLLDNQSHLFGFAGINTRELTGYLVLMRKLLFRRFLIDKRCDFIFLVEMPP